MLTKDCFVGGCLYKRCKNSAVFVYIIPPSLSEQSITRSVTADVLSLSLHALQRVRTEEGSDNRELSDQTHRLHCRRTNKNIIVKQITTLTLTQQHNYSNTDNTIQRDRPTNLYYLHLRGL